MLLEELGERLLVEQGLGLLVEEGLVCRAAALGDEEELVLHAGLAAVDVDLCREVGARVLLVDHRERYYLRVAQVAVLVCLIYAAGDAGGIVGTRIYILALVGYADGRTRILTRGQLAFGRYRLVEKHGVCDELVVVRGFGILEYRCELSKVCRTQVERYVGIGLLREQFQTFGVYFQYFTSVALDDLNVILRQKAVLGGILLDGIGFLIDEISHSLSLFYSVYDIVTFVFTALFRCTSKSLQNYKKKCNYPLRQSFFGVAAASAGQAPAARGCAVCGLWRAM